MMNMYSIKKQFFMALALFSFFILCGFLSIPINARTEFFKSTTLKKVHNELDFSIKVQNPISNLNNGSIQLTVSEGMAPFKISIYSTTTALKEYQVKEELTVNNLAAGEYMIVVSGRNNQYRSKTITLRHE